MDDEIKEKTSEELLEIYKKTTDFLKFINKEYDNAEKMRDLNE